jgi:hypothetical protein
MVLILQRELLGFVVIHRRGTCDVPLRDDFMGALIRGLIWGRRQ